MSCPGLHCPGCSGVQSLGVLAAAGVVLCVAYETVAVVARYIVPVAAVVVACFALSVAAAVWLEGRSDRRAAEWGAARGIVSRADVILPPPPPRAAIAPQVVNFNFYGADTARAAAVIRHAIPGAAGDADK